MPLVFRGTLAHSLSLGQLEIVEHATIGVNSDGTILFVARTEAETTAQLAAHPHHTIIDLGDKLLIPGFIDTHCHAPQYLFDGTSITTSFT